MSSGISAELDEVLGRDLGKQAALVVGVVVDGLFGSEADGLAPQAPPDDVLQPHEGAAADEQDVGGVDLDVLLLGVLAPALGRNVGDGALEHLEQRLLDAFARYVTGD